MAVFFRGCTPSELMLSLIYNEVIDNYHLLCDNNAAVQEKMILLSTGNTTSDPATRTLY